MQTNFDVALPQRLKELRGNKTQDEIASLLGVKQQTYAHWELGRRQPKLNDLCLVALHFGVSADWLLGLPSANTSHVDSSSKSLNAKISALKKNAQEASTSVERLLDSVKKLEGAL